MGAPFLAANAPFTARIGLPRGGVQSMPVDGAIPLHLNPNIVQVGPFVLTWHGFFTAVGTVVGIWLAVKWASAAGVAEDEVLSVAMWGVIGAIIGARLFHVVDQWDYYVQDPLAIVRINEGGLAIFGTVVGGPLAGAIYAARRRLPVPLLADVTAPCLILGMGIGRIGDIINGEHHGAYAEGFPLAFTYTHPATLAECFERTAELCSGPPIHLAVGYEMLLDFAIFALCVWLARGVARKANGRIGWAWAPRYPRNGMLFWIMLALYSAGRFVVQFYRYDTIFALGLSQAQLVSILTLMIAVWALVYQASRTQPGGQPMPPLPAA